MSSTDMIRAGDRERDRDRAGDRDRDRAGDRDRDRDCDADRDGGGVRDPSSELDPERDVPAAAILEPDGERCRRTVADRPRDTAPARAADRFRDTKRSVWAPEDSPIISIALDKVSDACDDDMDAARERRAAACICAIAPRGGPCCCC